MKSYRKPTVEPEANHVLQNLTFHDVNCTSELNIAQGIVNRTAIPLPAVNAYCVKKDWEIPA